MRTSDAMVTPKDSNRSGPNGKSSLLTISNGLTSLRLLAAPFFYCAIVNQAWGLACALFWLAVASDVVDGRVARARGEVTAFGGVLDHGTDATFVALAHVALAAAGISPVLLPFLIVAAFLQYMFDSKILAGHSLRASFIGRWNGIGYFVAPGILVTREALGLTVPPDSAIRFFGTLLVGLTLVSMINRLVAVASATRNNSTPS